jgi:hypothetical protein
MMGRLFVAARLRDPIALEELLKECDESEIRGLLSQTDPLHPLFCVQSVRGLELLLCLSSAATLTDESGCLAASNVFGRHCSTEQLGMFLDRGVDPFFQPPDSSNSAYLRLNLFGLCLRRGTASDLQLLLSRFPDRGKEYVRRNVDRVLDNFGNGIELMKYLQRHVVSEIATRERLLKVLFVFVCGSCVSWFDFLTCSGFVLCSR